MRIPIAVFNGTKSLLTKVVYVAVVLPCKGVVAVLKGTVALVKNPSKQSKAIAAKSIPVVGLIGSIVFFRFLSDENRINVTFMAYLKAVFDGMGGQFLMAPLVSRPVSSLGNEIQTAVMPKKFMNPSLLKRVDLEAEAETMRPHISASHFSEIDRMLKEWHLASENGLETYGERLEKRLKVLTSIPFQKFRYISKQQFQSAFKPKILDLTANFEIGIRGQLKELVRDIVDNINCPYMSNSIAVVKPMILEGPPGIGKTRLIAEIARIFRIPCVMKKLSGLQAEVLEGGSVYDENPKNGIVLDAWLQGKKLAKERGYHESTTMILFLDELDKAFAKSKKSGSVATLKTWLLDIINNSDDYQVKPYNYASFDLRKIIIIGAVNRDFVAGFEREDREAFATRLRFIRMPALTPLAKKNIGEQVFKNMVATYVKDMRERLQKAGKTTPHLASVMGSLNATLASAESSRGEGLGVGLGLGTRLGSGFGSALAETKSGAESPPPALTADKTADMTTKTSKVTDAGTAKASDPEKPTVIDNDELLALTENLVIFNQQDEEIVAKIIAFDKREGVRVMLNVIDAYFRFRRGENYFEDFGRQTFEISEVYKVFEKQEDEAQELNEATNSQNSVLAQTSSASVETKQKLESNSESGSEYSDSDESDTEKNEKDRKLRADQKDKQEKTGKQKGNDKKSHTSQRSIFSQKYKELRKQMRELKIAKEELDKTMRTYKKRAPRNGYVHDNGQTPVRRQSEPNIACLLQYRTKTLVQEKTNEGQKPILDLGRR